jgi:hypothetical protein
MAADTVLLTHVRRAAAKPPRRELAHRALEDITLHRQLRVLLVQGLRDGGELELTTPITNEFNLPPPAVRSVRSGTGRLRKCRWPDPAARIPATCGRGQRRRADRALWVRAVPETGDHGAR